MVSPIIVLTIARHPSHIPKTVSFATSVVAVAITNQNVLRIRLILRTLEMAKATRRSATVVIIMKTFTKHGTAPPLQRFLPTHSVPCTLSPPTPPTPQTSQQAAAQAQASNIQASSMRRLLNLEPIRIITTPTPCTRLLPVLCRHHLRLTSYNSWSLQAMCLICLILEPLFLWYQASEDS